MRPFVQAVGLERLVELERLLVLEELECLQVPEVHPGLEVCLVLVGWLPLFWQRRWPLWLLPLPRWRRHLQPWRLQ